MFVGFLEPPLLARSTTTTRGTSWAARIQPGGALFCLSGSDSHASRRQHLNHCDDSRFVWAMYPAETDFSQCEWSFLVCTEQLFRFFSDHHWCVLSATTTTTQFLSFWTRQLRTIVYDDFLNSQSLSTRRKTLCPWEFSRSTISLCVSCSKIDLHLRKIVWHAQLGSWWITSASDGFQS